MKATLPSDEEIAREAIDILMNHMEPSKVARLMINLKLGSGDYTAERDKLFAGETVESLFAKIKDFKKQ